MRIAHPLSFLLLTTAACVGVDAPNASLGPLPGASIQSIVSDVPEGAKLMLTIPATDALQRRRGTSIQALPLNSALTISTSSAIALSLPNATSRGK